MHSMPCGDTGAGAARLWACVLAAIWLITSAPAGAQERSSITLTVEEDQSLRDIAEEYLGDPDLWSEILRANGLDSITDVQPGSQIEIPVGPIAEANRAIEASLQAIAKATGEGARLFAPDQIEQAIELHETAMSRRQTGAWDEAAALAGQATSSAEEALSLAVQQRDHAAEALLSDREGWVEGQKPQELVWTDRALQSLLIEQEKVRTLSRSSAQITFRDDSRLRLNANSQAMIQRMRVDPLSRREEAKVSLIEGDFYALLGGTSERKKFELDIPEVETTIESRNFWVRRDVNGSKFTNYDDAPLRVSAQNASVDLGRHEATLVRTGEAPSPKMDVLPAPALVEPADDSVAFDLRLHWRPIENAAGYWLEVAEDPEFKRMTVSRFGLIERGFEIEDIEVGSYYWRVAALDKFGLPGVRSEVWRFHVRVDGTPPFLTISEPTEGAIVRESAVQLRGVSEPEALLGLAGVPLAMDDEGAFEAPYEAKPGLNEIVIEATDAAGNITRRTRSFQYMPDEETVVVFDDAIPRRAPRHFVTDRDVLALTGSAKPDAKIVVRVAGGGPRTSAYTDAAGRFTINVPLKVSAEQFEVEVTAASGFVSRDGFTASVDREPPDIGFDPPPPTVTAVEWLPLRGRAAGATSLTINGESVLLVEEAFDQSVTLRPGSNDLELVATDLVGNVRIERLQVELDQEPPKLVRRSVSRSTTAGGEPVTVEVVAEDPAGLKKVASYTLRVGATKLPGLLEFNHATGTYRATVFVKPAGRVAIEHVDLEDYAGNKKRYSF